MKKGFTKDQYEWIWALNGCLLPFPEVKPDKPALSDTLHTDILGMVVHVYYGLLCFNLILWYSNERRPSRGDQAGWKGEGGNMEGGRPACYNGRFIVWGLQASLVFLGLKPQHCPFFKPHFKQPPLFIHQHGVSLTRVEMLNLPPITYPCLYAHENTSINKSEIVHSKILGQAVSQWVVVC